MLEFRKMRVRFLVSLIVLIGTYVLLVIFREKTLEMLNQIPEGFKGLVKESFLNRLRNDPVFYIVSQWNMKNFVQMMPVVAIVIGFPLISREVEKGTIHFLLSNRTRRDVFFEKLKVGIVSTSILSMTAALPIFNGLDISNAAVYVLHSIVFSVLWFSMALLFSTFFNDQVKPLISSLAVLGGFAVLETTKILKLNVFNYITNPALIDSPKIDLCTTVKLTIASVILIFLAYYNFKTSEF